MNKLKNLLYLTPLVPAAYSINGMISHSRDRKAAFYNFCASIAFITIYRRAFRNPIPKLQPTDYFDNPIRLRSFIRGDNIATVLPACWLVQSFCLSNNALPPTDLEVATH
ncbi:hypothetical protein SAMD00019534_024050 [Acytostelium subglobosum LB1]|uniref:hypothetical protein n=1 Tax=Acytostelium subglobosum LB1 TaxID=1410327 RepID=UPI00064511A7|nr:hypothetical protein SAMD00019534_024050 [Acytostelium subglobosum LB1]GAM19230.1 hypothetical protein SAMD00019534_024050 [Acytostelium subglobosum LB1]|eukprot:XP_012757157.1 hypothetical protein SAMD00019534_024050 [Acytostelium subglobosum LB1]